MTDGEKNRLQIVPDLPEDTPDPPTVDENGKIIAVPGYSPPAPDLRVTPNKITEVPPMDTATPVERPLFVDPDEVQESVNHHPSNLPDQP